MEIKSSDFFKIPNLLSILRILMLVPFIIIIKKQNTEWFIILACIAILTDWLDGYIARKWNQVSKLGIVLDPLADKTNTAAIVLALHYYQDFPIWITIVIIGRDILIVLGALFIFRRKRFVTTSNMPGKVAVFFIAISVLIFVLNQELLFNVTLYIAFFFILLSFITYLKKFLSIINGRQISEGK